MKEHPIIFSTEMVKQIIAGNKTKSRRIIKHQPKIDEQTGDWYMDAFNEVAPIEDWKKVVIPNCPYGKVGDTLYVRETWQRTDNSISFEPGYVYKASDPDWDTMENWKWKPSIFMPRKAARIFLGITNIEVERLQDISDGDVAKEGVVWNEPLDFKRDKRNCNSPAQRAFRRLWDKINGEESWDKNPFVWVIEFKKAENSYPAMTNQHQQSKELI